MKKPPDIVMHGRMSHLADSGAMRTWCSKSVVGAAVFPLEPGADFGEDKNDCLECTRQLKEGAQLEIYDAVP